MFKFEIGQEVFAMRENTVVKRTIHVRSYRDEWNYGKKDRVMIRYNLGRTSSTEWYAEESLFATKEELLASL